MPYNISRIQNYTSSSGVFFFDTNIWIDVLAPKIGKISRRTKLYTNFFEKVDKDSGGKIAVNKLLFSELINTYMHVIALRSYEEETGNKVPRNEFKTKYRPTQHYKDQYEIICDDIFSRSDSFEFVDFPYEKIDFSDVILYPKLDFNDYCYYKAVLENKVKLVTNDFDFFVEDIEILTLNDTLYNEQFLKAQKKKAINEDSLNIEGTLDGVLKVSIPNPKDKKPK